MDDTTPLQRLSLPRANRVIDGNMRNGRRGRRRTQRREHPPAPSHESPTACARLAARVPRQVFGLMGFGECRPTWRCFPGKSPVLCAPFVPNYRCGAAPECASLRCGHRVPFSAWSMFGAGTVDGHKILWFADAVNVRTEFARVGANVETSRFVFSSPASTRLRSPRPRLVPAQVWLSKSETPRQRSRYRSTRARRWSRRDCKERLRGARRPRR